MGTLEDLVGREFGGLVTLERAANRGKRAAWLCECERCGARREYIAQHLRSGRAKCPCRSSGRASLNVEIVDDATPSQQRSRERATWLRILGQCHRESNSDYPIYGGCGVYVCERWRTFSRFLEDVGQTPEDRYLFALIGDHYGPGCCQWMTPSERARCRVSNRIVVVEGEAKPLIDWVEAGGANYTTTRRRLDRGISAESALADPPTPLEERWCKPITYKGCEYKSLADLARAHGQTPQRVYDRRCDGWPIDLAVETPPGEVRA